MSSSEPAFDTVSPLYTASTGSGAGSGRASMEMEVAEDPAVKRRQWVVGAVVMFVAAGFMVGSCIAILQYVSTLTVPCVDPSWGCAKGYALRTVPNVSVNVCITTESCGASQWYSPTDGCVAVHACTGGTFSLSTSCDTTFTCYGPAGAWQPGEPCLRLDACTDPMSQWNGGSCAPRYGLCITIENFLPKMGGSIAASAALPIIVFAIEYLASLRRNSGRPRKVPVLKWLTDHSLWELTQLAVTLTGCGSYLYYLNQVQVISYPTPTGGIAWAWDLDSYHQFTWIAVEIFVVMCYMFDYLLRLASLSPYEAPKFVFSFYGIVDVLSFATVVYPPFWSYDWSQISPHSLFLIVGPLRWLRVRRSVQSLDGVRRGADVKMGPFTISDRTAAIFVLLINIIVYILVSASIILFCEYPCSVMENVPGSCNSSFQLFYSVVYYIIVTYSTVGYGDISPATPIGRVVMSVLIIFMLVNVPIQINALSAHFVTAPEDDDETPPINEVLDTVRALDADLRRHFHIPAAQLSVAVDQSPSALKKRLVASLQHNASSDVIVALARTAKVSFRNHEDAADALVQALFLRDVK